MQSNPDHFKDTKLIITYARELIRKNQELVTKVAILKDENEGLKEYNNTLLHTNIKIGSDEFVTLLYAKLRDEYGNLVEEHEKLNKVYSVILEDNTNLKDISSKSIKHLNKELTIKTEQYEKEMIGITQALEQKNKLLQKSVSKVGDLQFKFDQTFGYYNERNDRLNQENKDLKSKILTLEKVNGDAQAEITILKKQKEQQLKKSTDLEDKLYYTERQLKSVQDKSNASRPNIPTYGHTKKSNKSYQNQLTKPSNSSFRPLNIANQNTPGSMSNETSDANDTITTTLTSNNALHFDSINLGSSSTLNKELSYNVNLSVTSKTSTTNPRRLLASSDFGNNDKLSLNQQLDDTRSNASIQDGGVGKRRNEHGDQEYLDIPVVKGMYSTNTTNKKRSRKLFDPDEI